MKISIESRAQKFRRGFFPWILSALLLPFISISGSARMITCPLEGDRKEINITGHYSRVEVRGDITIVLTNGPSATLQMQGTIKDLESIKTTVMNGKLVIDAQRKRSMSKLTVYLSATALSSLIINGNSEIFSSGKITINDLEIQLNGSSLVGVFHEGKMKVTPGEGYVLDNLDKK